MISCPFPIDDYPTVQMAHGGGGRLMGQLIDKIFLTAFGAPPPELRHDSAILDPGSGRLAFTTDAFVVRPMIFPGGDLGSLAVHGTINDLAMAGARPLALSASFILEEGLSIETLWHIASSMARAAEEAGVRIVTGDTKVVDRGKGDGIYITTSGVGRIDHPRSIAPGEVREGDAILVSGDLGRHGMAVMAEREGLEFESDITSDSAPLAGPALALLDAGLSIHCLRDLTRGGLTATLNEIAAATSRRIEIEERLVPVRDDVAGACAFLGLDPFQVACEGRFAIFLPAAEADRALEILRAHPVAEGATRIGAVTGEGDGRVVLAGTTGTKRLLDLPAGEQLPRIC